jgi:hypothetical protein
MPEQVIAHIDIKGERFEIIVDADERLIGRLERRRILRESSSQRKFGRTRGRASARARARWREHLALHSSKINLKDIISMN